MTGFWSSNFTAHQSKYFAHELTLMRAADDSQKLTTALLDAQVDLNPHQVDAALFAFKSPLSQGAILADEVGLGKTIEAGLVMTQKWAERRRRMLVICPASLRPQWRDELGEKFHLPSLVIEAKAYNTAQRAGSLNPFDRPDDEPAVLICSFHFAANKETDLLAVPWDLVVIDEAHRLRNVYRPDNKIGRKIRGALATAPKILLTATPLQNSLLELYGLVSFIDEHAFGDVKAFRERYARVTNEHTFQDLKSRLAPLCHRTLRRQVTEYVKYTNRVPLTQEFRPTVEEQVLYDLVSEYLRRPSLYSLPPSQRALLTLVLRKLLASSTFAIAGALDSLARRLQRVLREEHAVAEQATTDEEEVPDFESDVDQLESLRDEWAEQDEGIDEDAGESSATRLTDEELAALEAEVEELSSLRDMAVAISENAKGEALLAALEASFAQASELGASQKAVIFTESRRTQEYLVRLLEQNGHGDGLVLFNGSNNDERAKAIYKAWVEEHAGSDRVSGSRSTDVRAALVDEFRARGRLMIATESAAEGINLQFCSIVVNYDLPWNPQRIEQRIGRCHRYGQLHDVVVVNFLNRDNAADQRVFELLDQKFRLFSGVFGASDEVLGAVESGVDIERRIADIYQRCRLPDEIDQEFQQLQLDLDEQITTVMADTRQKLLENFDAEVHDRLRVNLMASREQVSKAESLLWTITRRELERHAEFDDRSASFRLVESPPGFSGAQTGDEFSLANTAHDHVHKYRIGHPLAEWVISHAKSAETPSVLVEFDYSGWEMTAANVEPFVGKRGWLSVEKLSFVGGAPEEHLLVAAVTDSGEVVGTEIAGRILEIPASAQSARPLAESPRPEVSIALESERLRLQDDLERRQADWFDQEMDKFDRWAEDQRHALRSDLNRLDADLKGLRRSARSAGALPEKLATQRKVRELESRRDKAWREYDRKAQDIEVKKDDLLDQVETRLSTSAHSEPLFTIGWTLR